MKQFFDKYLNIKQIAAEKKRVERVSEKSTNSA